MFTVLKSTNIKKKLVGKIERSHLGGGCLQARVNIEGYNFRKEKQSDSPCTEYITSLRKCSR